MGRDASLCVRRGGAKMCVCGGHLEVVFALSTPFVRFFYRVCSVDARSGLGGCTECYLLENEP